MYQSKVICVEVSEQDLRMGKAALPHQQNIPCKVQDLHNNMQQTPAPGMVRVIYDLRQQVNTNTIIPDINNCDMVFCNFQTAKTQLSI